MTYAETVAYLYAQVPLFQSLGAGAYKEGLSNTLALDEHFGHPHRAYRTIHVAGTNGKGSTSHALAAVLQQAGYRVGLYTSPHLVDMRERIRVNGQPISEQRIVDFVADHRAFFEPLSPSFFEVITALALLYFAEQRVDVAVIEVGLGGRLDCTNVIRPDLAVITNIALDHTDLLGHTLAQIAHEKAGIIKPQVPVVVGQALPETRPVFEAVAAEQDAPLFFAEEAVLDPSAVDFELKGACQQHNLRTILTALRHLPAHYAVTDAHIREGLAHVCRLTGLMGRWQTIATQPRVICDTGHNVDAWCYLGPSLGAIAAEQTGALHIVFGMAGDKDVDSVIALLPRAAHYYFTQASVRRALPAAAMRDKCRAHGLEGEAYPTVAEALAAARRAASAADTIFVGGSSFVVADLLRDL